MFLRRWNASCTTAGEESRVALSFRQRHCVRSRTSFGAFRRHGKSSDGGQWRERCARSAAGRLLAGIAAGLALAGLVYGLGWWTGKGSASGSPVEYQQITFRTGSIGNARFTPDGSIVYSASWEGGDNQLYMSRTDDPGSRELGIKDAELLSISKSGEMAIRLNTVGHGGYARSGTLARVR